MADRPLINHSLALLNFYGLITYDGNSWSKCKNAILSVVALIGYTDVLLCAIVNWNEPESIQNVLYCFGFGQVVLKLIVYKSKHLLLTLKKMDEFYPLSKDDMKKGIVNGEIFTQITTFLKSFLVLVILIFALFLSRTFFSATNQLPFKSFFFQSKKFPGLEIGYMYEVVVLISVTPIQVGFDILYISMVTNIVYEFKLLKRGFAELPISMKPESDKHTLKVLGDLINHHNVILKCSRALRRAYFFPFLCIFAFNMLIIGFCLLCILSIGFSQNIEVVLLYGTCAIFYMVQLFLYCAPGTILILESTGVSDIVFNTDWWIKTQPQLRKTYVRILQRANKPVLLSAGGMMNVTLETFTKILKNTLSFFTCVLAIYRKNV